ncbi:hypothetical protein EHI8A_076420 [Entamoeba histolytica HM-1:IMSS-B]|uniref:Uncharacterized protein n=6 Tax=Entamoeba histolytica TaxID=5759 RepID=C4M1G9_ENTH1|nr:hypothetical protein EHI_192490 [Entamoeba histolytica HM-1:IMSS]EMD47543.1 Hypothetical protein EHI5A_069850 [Entamoeba histolytica KU27]EMH75807.1 hypothetical protein EHI8A_076420 [Entamoeba histolytica HM-1:IMSS-B]EMS11234.1 hypothetical protein KM1_136240 [Entamoeba histolytica HM-3:IMSS]ENY65610.1 hypothetical protein EHI7A_073690 [Entamoeba histolytica HM-1:IMSS-A]GAT95054.1 hypothetical protein CL6EHI_192490 [Entamoeba histolytica]|eukprot:XP_653881.1 hypothetical protein EHI_192490 [Entamoeba histolytica HM-1:IMSS]
MSQNQIYTPLTLLSDESGDLVQGVIYIWNFINEFKKEIEIEDSSFKSLVTALYYEDILKEDWTTIKLYQFLIPIIFHYQEMYWFERMDMPINKVTIPGLLCIILEKEGSTFSLNAMEYIKYSYLSYMIQPRVKVSVIVKLIQIFLNTNIGKEIVKHKCQTKIIGIDRMCRYFMCINNCLIIETSELNWMLVDTEFKMNNLIQFYGQSKNLREIELSKHLIKIKDSLHLEQSLYQEFGIRTSMIEENQCKSIDYKSYSNPTNLLTSESITVKEITIQLIQEVRGFLETLKNSLEKRQKRIKGSLNIINIISGLKFIPSKNINSLLPFLNTTHSMLLKIIQKLPICYQDELYYKKIIQCVNKKSLTYATVSTTQVLFYMIQRVVDFKHVTTRLDQSSYEDISFSDFDYELEDSSQEPIESLTNIVNSEENKKPTTKSTKTKKDNKMEEENVGAVIIEDGISEESDTLLQEYEIDDSDEGEDDDDNEQEEDGDDDTEDEISDDTSSELIGKGKKVVKRLKRKNQRESSDSSSSSY